MWHLPSFHKLSGSLQFSRSDRRHLGVNLSRIDRIYVDDYFDTGGEVGIIGCSLFSDHAPMILKLVRIKKHTRFSSKIPISLFSNDIFRSQFLGIWNYKMGTQLSIVFKVQKALYLIAEFFKDKAMVQLQEAKQKILASRHTVVALQKLQEKNQQAIWVGVELHQARVEMQLFEDVIAQHKFRASSAKWSHLADKVNAEFFSCK